MEFGKKLLTIDPARLVDPKKSDDVSDFFLVLGIFYNDLKSLSFYLIKANKDFEEIKNEPSPEKGEFGGIKAHLSRLMAATLHEFFDFINQNLEIIRKEEFQLIYKDLSQQQRQRWDLMMDISSGQDSNDSSDLAKILVFIRNNLAFHYYQSAKLLRKGFVDFFFNDEKVEENGTAYYSMGDKMRETRFYYCDASAERALRDKVMTAGLSIEEYNERLGNIIRDVNFCLMDLMKIYIKGRPY